MSSYDGRQFHVERHVGLIGDTFTKQPVLDRLKGTRAIGHTRYATAGGPGLSNVDRLTRGQDLLGKLRCPLTARRCWLRDVCGNSLHWL